VYKRLNRLTAATRSTETALGIDVMIANVKQI